MSDRKLSPVAKALVISGIAIPSIALIMVIAGFASAVAMIRDDADGTAGEGEVDPEDVV